MSRILPERYINDIIDGELSKHNASSKKYGWSNERNVVDKYKYLSTEEIAQRVQADRAPYAILMTHIDIDYNLGNVLRIGNCLGAKVYYYGTKKWDKRAAMGVWHYTPINFLPSIESVRSLKDQYHFVALEQTKSSIPLHQFDWKKSPKEKLIIVGEESRGLQQTPEILELADDTIEIIQKGSVRSLNASSSVAIAAYDFLFKNNLF